MRQGSNKRSHQLYELIKSLSKSEKRFFKIFSKRHVIGEKNKYVELFDAIESQNEYDEASIISQFEGERFIKRLAVAKGYLYELILKSMNQYHAQNGIHNQILSLTRQISFLFDKNLFRQAQKILSKTYDLAAEYEKVSILPELLHWHKKIMEAQFYSGKQIDDIEKLYKREEEVLDQIVNQNEYWLLQAKLYYQHNLKGIIRNSDDLNKIEDIYNSTLMKKEEQALTYRAKIQFNKIYSTYFFILRDFDSCYRYIKRATELYEKRQSFIESYPLEYIQSVNNLLNITQVLNKPDETLAGLNKLRHLMENEKYRNKEKIQLKLFESYYYHLLNLHLEKDDFVGGYQYIPEIEKGIKKFSDGMNKMGELMLHYHLFQICFGARKFESAHKWVNKILGKKGSDIRQDILSFAHILNLMVQYEMKTFDNIETQINGTIRFLKQRKSSYKFESIVAEYLQDLKQIETPLELKASFVQLRSQFQSLTDDPFEKKAFAYYDFIGWLDNKINSKAVRRKNTAV